MQLNKALTMGLGAALSLSLIACGGGPDIDQVKADFENPSGSTTNKDSVMSASSQANASGPVRALGASGVPGQSLTARGKVRGFGEVETLNRYAPLAEQSYYRIMHNESRPLRTAQTINGDCSNGEAERASEEIFNELALDAVFGGGGSASGSASFSMDMGSCTEGRVTGKVDVDMEIEISDNEFYFRITEKLNNVCETDGEKACLNGTLLLEASATADMNGQAGELQFYVAWEVDGTWEEMGQARSASLKGGVRTIIGGDGMGMGYGSIEYLVYAIDKDGNEYSYVYRLTANWDGVGGGNGSLEIRGSDGTLSCEFTAEMVTCTGSNGAADLTWTASEEVALSAEVYGG